MDLPSDKPVRASLAAQIRERLVERILSGELKPGDRLVEMRIAAQMQTSQAPVREALRELQAMGLVETLHNRGARVRLISDSELAEIYDVRAQLEGYAAELVATRGVSLRAALEDEIAAMAAAAAAGDSQGFSEHNTRFHRLMVAATGNATLEGLWEGLNVRTRTMLNVIRRRSDLAEVSESHRAIVEALESGDPARARATAIAHVLDNKP